MVEESDIRDSLKDVEDPEMKISVIELGLIYGIRIEERQHRELIPTGCTN